MYDARYGTWSVLRHLYPEADVPVVQLSIDRTKLASFHYEIAQKLGVLREETILIIGSGNIVHNLSAYIWGEPQVAPFDWAVRFEERVRELLLAEDDGPLINCEP